MPGEVNLKPCPFCGGEAERYETDSGCVKVNCRKCHIETPWGKHRFEADDIDKWNRRATEPGTSVIRWTLYDGRPKTLPEPMKSVLMIRPFCIGMNIRFLTAGNPVWKDAGGYQDDVDAKSGDLWAHFPEPPEGME